MSKRFKAFLCVDSTNWNERIEPIVEYSDWLESGAEQRALCQAIQHFHGGLSGLVDMDCKPSDSVDMHRVTWLDTDMDKPRSLNCLTIQEIAKLHAEFKERINPQAVQFLEELMGDKHEHH